MVADPDGNAVLIQHGADIMRMHPVDIERDDAELVLSARRDLHIRNARQLVNGIAG